MSQFPLLKGVKLRATRINSCGLPIAGPANRIVTSGFVTVTLAQERRDANNIEQLNAEGKVCVADRTAPQRKWYNITLELCQVNTGLITMFSGWEQVLNWADDPVGLRDKVDVDTEFGVAIEVWTAGRGEDDCPTPVTDSILSGSGGSGRQYGYLLFGGIEWYPSSDIAVTADVTTVTLSGITIPMTQWGRGPYNVVATNSSGTPGRLLTPFSKEPHMHLERTPVAPPEDTPGSDPAALAVASIFTAPHYYFGGPSAAPAADVAPAQPAGS